MLDCATSRPCVSYHAAVVVAPLLEGSVTVTVCPADTPPSRVKMYIVPDEPPVPGLAPRLVQPVGAVIAATPAFATATVRMPK